MIIQEFQLQNLQTPFKSDQTKQEKGLKQLPRSRLPIEENSEGRQHSKRSNSNQYKTDSRETKTPLLKLRIDLLRNPLRASRLKKGIGIRQNKPPRRR